MHILSHRGLGNSNSLQALNDALRAGFSLETDVRLSCDGQLVVVHDQNLKTTFGIDTNMRELNYWALAEKQPEFTKRIPLLESFIENTSNLLQSGQQIALHIKDYDNLDLIFRTCEIIQKYQLQENIFIFDVLLRDLAQIKKRFPKIRIGISVGEAHCGPTIFTLEDIKPYLDSIDIIWADEWNTGLYTEDFFMYCEKAHKPVYLISPELHTQEKHPFTKNPKQTWEQVAPFRVAGICTDFPLQGQDFFVIYDQSNSI